ncbi:MAG: DUF4956 domain-containing protein [Epsilonproteobacteria bacterium]|nr:DUF4956 domain-containing protein [Campylobacterota bacterium]
MQQLNFSDIFSKSFVAMQSGVDKFTIADIVINMVVTFLIGLFIFFVYKKTFRGVLYQKSFNISLIAISMVVTLVIMTISGNLVLSLGMVGALSIVRFRTPIKDPIDLVFIFWAIAVGIANGVGYFNISIIGSILITIVLFVMARTPSLDKPYLLVMQIPHELKESEVVDSVKKAVLGYELKSKTINPSYYEITSEVRLRNDDSSFLNELYSKGVKKATLISYSGDLEQV